MTMSMLEEYGILSEIKCDANLSYIVNEDTAFLPTEYKVLRHQQNSVFVDGCRILFNGKIQLYYFTNEYISLETEIKQVKEDEVIDLLINLYKSLIEVKNNGFLNLKSVVINLAHIYVHRVTKQVKLIYLPLNRREYSDDTGFENKLCEELAEGIKAANIHDGHKIPWITEQLMDKTLGLEQLYAILKNSKSIKKSEKGFEKKHGTAYLKIYSEDANHPMIFTVSKEKFLIGRKNSAVDGVISFNQLVGRIHCQINRQGFNFTIMDLQSVNGTYINGKRLRPNIEYPISDGDRLKIATSEFSVRIELEVE